MKIKFILLSAFILSCVTSAFSEGGIIGAGQGGSGGGLSISQRSVSFYDLPIEVQIVDSKTSLEISIVFFDELDDVLKNLPRGEYLLIYRDSNGNELDRILLSKD